MRDNDWDRGGYYVLTELIEWAGGWNPLCFTHETQSQLRPWHIGFAVGLEASTPTHESHHFSWALTYTSYVCPWTRWQEGSCSCDLSLCLLRPCMNPISAVPLSSIFTGRVEGLSPRHKPFHRSWFLDAPCATRRAPGRTTIMLFKHGIDLAGPTLAVHAGAWMTPP